MPTAIVTHSQHDYSTSPACVRPAHTCSDNSSQTAPLTRGPSLTLNPEPKAQTLNPEPWNLFFKPETRNGTTEMADPRKGLNWSTNSHTHGTP